MKAAFLVASLVGAVGVFAQQSAQPWTSCMLNCMEGAATSAGCGSSWNSTECLCLNAQWVSAARSCMYAPCVSDVYPFYNLREAECGTLTRDLDNAAFVPSNGNSTWDEANPNGNTTVSSIIASLSPSASASGSGAARPSGSASVTGGGPARSSGAGSATPTSASPSRSAAPATSSSSAAGVAAAIGSKESLVAVLAACGVLAGSLMTL